MEDTLIISNTTPIINFAEIGRIDLLESLFGTVVIPPAVEKEVRAKASPFPHASKMVEQGNFPIVAPADELLVRALCATVHPGVSDLRTKARFWLADNLTDQVLRELR